MLTTAWTTFLSHINQMRTTTLVPDVKCAIMASRTFARWKVPTWGSRVTPSHSFLHGLLVQCVMSNRSTIHIWAFDGWAAGNWTWFLVSGDVLPSSSNNQEPGGPAASHSAQRLRWPGQQRTFTYIHCCVLDIVYTWNTQSIRHSLNRQASQAKTSSRGE